MASVPRQAFQLVTAAAAVVALSCANLGADPDLLKFLEDGKATKAAVVLKLGRPSATFEQERFWTYRLGKDDEGYFLIERSERQWFGIKYSLVLVFDPQGTLERHALVEVR